MSNQQKCKCCDREKELRFGYCFDCAECESVIKDGLDMWGEPINNNIEGASKYMSRLQYILEKYKKKKTND